MGGLARGEVLDGFHVDAGVVFDGRVGVFQLVAGEDADDAIRRGRSLCSSSSLLQAGDAGGAGGFAAEAAAGDHGAVLEDFLVGDFATTPFMNRGRAGLWADSPDGRFRWRWRRCGA